MSASGCRRLGCLTAMCLQQVSSLPFVLVFSSAKIGIKLPLTSHELVEGLNGIMDAKAHCELLNPYTDVMLPGALEQYAGFQTYAAGARYSVVGLRILQWFQN